MVITSFHLYPETPLKMLFHTRAVASLGYLSCLASPLFAAALQTKVLSTRSVPYMTRILDTGTTFLEENNGVWQLIE
jgi:hypothetical protein